MPSSPDQEQLERRLSASQMLPSIEQMEENVAKFKHDVEMSNRQLEHAIATDAKKNRLEMYKIIISIVVGAAACVGAGIALATYVEYTTASRLPNPRARPDRLIPTRVYHDNAPLVGWT